MAGSLKTYDAVSLTVRTMQAYPSSDLVARAISLAAFVHDGQTRRQLRAGVDYYDPYIAHPLRNALRIARWYEGQEYSRDVMALFGAVAILHDTVEDGAERILDYYDMFVPSKLDKDSALAVLTLEFGENVADAVFRLTNTSDKPSPEQYLRHLITNVVGDEVAFVAKASDLVDNAGSLKHMDAGTRRERLASKYEEPLMLMIENSDTVSNAIARGRIARRLDQVVNEVRDLSRASTVL